jgi:hypothetical protein
MELEHLALDYIYLKPWYEYRALELMQILQSQEQSLKSATVLSDVSFAGKLGRVVEQYYWRFQHEGDAISGDKSKKGASVGGTERARRYKDKGQRAAWQKAATEFWSKHPEWTKSRVANEIEKRDRAACQKADRELRSRHPEWSEKEIAEDMEERLQVPRTAKHIARYVSRPLQNKK